MQFCRCIQALLSVISEVQPKWDIVAVTEDNVLPTSALTWDVGCKHRTLRHWPGDGSRAMRFFPHDLLANLHAKIQWSGRARLLLVALGELLQCRAENQFAVFLLQRCHSLLEQSLADATSLLRLRVQCAITLAGGAWNVDQLAAL